MITGSVEEWLHAYRMMWQPPPCCWTARGYSSIFFRSLPCEFQSSIYPVLNAFCTILQGSALFTSWSYQFFCRIPRKTYNIVVSKGIRWIDFVESDREDRWLIPVCADLESSLWDSAVSLQCQCECLQVAWTLPPKSVLVSSLFYIPYQYMHTNKYT